MGEIKFQALTPESIDFNMSINFTAREWHLISADLDSINYANLRYPSRHLIEVIRNLVLKSEEHFSELVVDRSE